MIKLRSEQRLAERASKHIEQAIELLCKTGLPNEWKHTEWREKAYRHMVSAQVLIDWELLGDVAPGKASDLEPASDLESASPSPPDRP
jgi:hypothetical protein